MSLLLFFFFYFEEGILAHPNNQPPSNVSNMVGIQSVHRAYLPSSEAHTYQGLQYHCHFSLILISSVLSIGRTNVILC